jgi:CRP/FNR family transcriptional regulator, cyclic AMP receptor protein
MGKQYRHVEHGKEAIVGVLGPGHFCGEGCLNGHPLRVTTATAMEPSEVTRIAKAAMIAALHDHPEFSELFMADLLSRNSRIEEDLIDQLFNSSEKRLARALLLLANFGKKATTEPISGNISQETLAEMIGTTRSRVSHFMNKFREPGFIDYNGHLEVHSSPLSVVLKDQGRTVAARDSPEAQDCRPAKLSESELRSSMSDKLPAPWEHCKATGFFGGSVSRECDGKGYRLIIDGRVIPPEVRKSGNDSPPYACRHT